MRKVKIRPIRLISYFLFFSLDIFFFLFLRNYFWLMIGMVMVGLPVVSIIGVFATLRKIQITLGAGNNWCLCGEVVPLELRIRNKVWYPVLDSQICFDITNCFFEQKDDVSLSMPVRIHGETMLRLPLELSIPGRFLFCATQIQMQDLLGLLWVRREICMEKEVVVVPKSKPQKEMDLTLFLAAATEMEESKKKGHDFAEVSDIRPYIPGDRIRDIHWKLSAKEEELMVKDRVSLAGSEMVLLLCLNEDKEETKKILETALGVCDAFAAIRQPMRVLCFDNEKRQYDSYQFLGKEEQEEAFIRFFHVPLRVRLGDEAMAYVKNLYPFLEQCLVIVNDDGSYRAEMKHI